MADDVGEVDELDQVDSTGIDFAADAVGDDELPFVVLSPEGEKGRVEEYGLLFERSE